MPNTSLGTVWNVRIPEVVAREVRGALDAADPEPQLASVVRRHPDLDSDIFLWAKQARQFETIQTVTGMEVGGVAGPVPDRIANYNVLAPLGSGGFGTVFLAEHRETGQRHAVKLLRQQHPTSSQAIEREFEVLASLDHPSVVAVHEHGVTDNKQPYYSMDYVAGLPLDAAFNAEVFSNDDLVSSLVQLSDSLSYIHHKQLVHRDVKPQNVLVDNDQQHTRSHLVDFGIVAVRLTADLATSRLRMVKTGQLFQQTLFTEQGAIVGTPGFMAPEQFMSSGDAPADVYALGVTVYLLLTGRFPVDPHAIMSAWSSDPRAAFDTIISTTVIKPTLAVRGGTETSHARRLASARLTGGLTDRQQRMLNTTLLRALHNDASLRHHDAAEVGEELASAFGLVPRRIGLLTHGQRLGRKIQKFFRRTPKEDDARNIRVWFITDRLGVPDRAMGLRFGSDEADDSSYGYSLVNLPTWYVIGQTRPGLVDRILGNTGYQVVKNKVLNRAEFESALLRRGNRKDLLLFVHGYNTTFEDAIVRSAQFQADLKMTGQVICFSWPSHGRLWSYGRDAAICEESEDHFVNALNLLTSVCDRHNLHVLAHSMGNRLLLQSCYSQAVSGRILPLGQVILAAPDVAQRRFRQRCHVYAGAKRRTMYTSKHDRALMGSRFLHARGRATFRQ